MMQMSSASRVFILGLVCFFVVGCASLTPETQYAKFARAGSAYAVAIDKLLVVIADLRVDANSWSLIIDKQDSGVTETDFEQTNQKDIELLKEVQRLRQHARLLGQYFILLEALATTDAADRTKDAIDKIVSKMEDAETKKELPNVSDALPNVGKLVVKLKVRIALHNELKDRKETLLEHLMIQETLLTQITTTVKSSSSLISEGEKNILSEQITSEKKLKNPKTWVLNRRRLLLARSSIQELTTASHLATELRTTFENLMSNKTTINEFDILISDIDDLLSTAEAIGFEGVK